MFIVAVPGVSHSRLFFILLPVTVVDTILTNTCVNVAVSHSQLFFILLPVTVVDTMLTNTCVIGLNQVRKGQAHVDAASAAGSNCFF